MHHLQKVLIHRKKCVFYIIYELKLPLRVSFKLKCRRVSSMSDACQVLGLEAGYAARIQLEVWDDPGMGQFLQPSLYNQKGLQAVLVVFRTEKGRTLWDLSVTFVFILPLWIQIFKQLRIIRDRSSISGMCVCVCVCVCVCECV